MKRGRCGVPAPVLAVLGALVWELGCLDRPIGGSPPVTTNLFVDRITQTSVDKIDLLFMIDNSASMSDKQAILRLAVPDLVGRLVNPACIDSDGRRGETPEPGAPCPVGQSREFAAIENINVAVVSSSLGDAGANDACSAPGFATHVPDRVDLAHLIGSLPRGLASGANQRGFLEWRAGSTDVREFSSKFERMVESVGESGCGWEASLESWYRFLIDPFPYRELVRVPCANGPADSRDCVRPATDAGGQIVLDDELLAQRAAFLRPDSLVAIIMLSDENDCSIAVGGSSWAVADRGRRMNRASSACDADPNALCCYMCGTAVPEGCAADPVCDVAPSAGIARGRHAAEDDGVNLRCYDQKRRFGHDFLYPTSRYVNALRAAELCVAHADLSVEGCPAGGLAPNPLFSGTRDRSLVFLGGIVGVPWQAIASDLDDRGNAIQPTALRFKTASELEQDGTWSEILGSPGVPSSAGVAGSPRIPPSNPFMIESPLARAGVERENEINGREYETDAAGPPGTAMDLQYACIFPLPTPRDCSAAAASDGCDCAPDDLDRPLCEREPGVSAPGTTQYWAKAYPGTRQLQVLQDYGQNSIVASICARNVDITTSDSRADFGYRPAVDSIVERLKEQLGDRCLPRGLLTTDPEEPVPCTLVESVPRPTEACECDPAIARRAPNEQTSALVRSELARERGQPCGSDDPTCSGACLCEVLQVQEVPSPDPASALRACQHDVEASGVEGWCYVADTESQQVGNPLLVAGCPPTKRQLLRFVGQGLRPNTTTFVACQGSSLAAQRGVLTGE